MEGKVFPRKKIIFGQLLMFKLVFVIDSNRGEIEDFVTECNK